MKVNFRTGTKSELLARRGEAVGHLEKLRETMASDGPFLPAIADVVEIELVNFIELCNEKLDLIEDANSSVPYEEVVQLAFDFLFVYTISKDEVPF